MFCLLEVGVFSSSIRSGNLLMLDGDSARSLDTRRLQFRNQLPYNLLLRCTLWSVAVHAVV